MLHCSCQLTYLGKTKNVILSRAIEHQQDSSKGKWENSGATEHTLDVNFNWLYRETIGREMYYRKRKPREALKLKRLNWITYIYYCISRGWISN